MPLKKRMGSTMMILIQKALMKRTFFYMLNFHDLIILSYGPITNILLRQFPRILHTHRTILPPHLNCPPKFVWVRELKALMMQEPTELSEYMIRKWDRPATLAKTSTGGLSVVIELESWTVISSLIPRFVTS